MNKDTKAVCTSRTPGSPDCFRNHVATANFFIAAKKAGMKVPETPWRFCPWCGQQLPENLKRQ